MNHGHIVAGGTSDEIILQHGSGERLEIRGGQELANYIRANTKLDVAFSGGVISIRLGQKTDALAALEAAERSGMEWGEIRTRVDSLDDVFVRLVGETKEEREGLTSEGTDG
jgi:ABC-type multidrug transport system ATPase subunit